MKLGNLPTEDMLGAAKIIGKILMCGSVATMPSTEKGKRGFFTSVVATKKDRRQRNPMKISSCNQQHSMEKELDSRRKDISRYLLLISSKRRKQGACRHKVGPLKHPEKGKDADRIGDGAGKPEVCLKSCLKKPPTDDTAVDVQDGERKVVQWKDLRGEELVEIMEFEFRYACYQNTKFLYLTRFRYQDLVSEDLSML